MNKKTPPVVRKHIHGWQKTAQHGNFVRRKCDDCGLVQHALVASENKVPDSVIHLAEADWSEGEGKPNISSYHGWSWTF